MIVVTTPSRRQQMLAAFVARLDAITTANGFETDAGQNVAVNDTPTMGDADPPTALAVLIGEDQVRSQGVGFLIDVPVEIYGIARADITDTPWLVVEAVVADIKRAIELEDRTLGGLVLQQFDRGSTTPVPRDDGSFVVAAVVRYTLPYKEAWGNP